MGELGLRGILCARQPPAIKLRPATGTLLPRGKSWRSTISCLIAIKLRCLFWPSGRCVSSEPARKALAWSERGVLRGALQEALDTVKEHVGNVMGPSSMAYSNTRLKMSKLQAAQVLPFIDWHWCIRARPSVGSLQQAAAYASTIAPAHVV